MYKIKNQRHKHQILIIQHLNTISEIAQILILFN